jgi:ubiquinone/menaquinone biosynthesis C-methylase UbiE
MLIIQKKNNPDLSRTLNEDICHTSLRKNSIDLVLLIDVLEHIPNPNRALKEIWRITDYVILKVPIENNVSMNTLNVISFGLMRKKLSSRIGHINNFSKKDVLSLLRKNNFEIISDSYAYSYLQMSKSRRHSTFIRQIYRVYYLFADKFKDFFPTLAPIIFNDFIIVLAQSKKND